MKLDLNIVSSSSTLIGLARVIANDSVDCSSKPNILVPEEQLDLLTDIQEILEAMGAPGFRMKQIAQIIAQVESETQEERDINYQISANEEYEKSLAAR